MTEPMNDPPTIADAEELTAVNQLIGRQRGRLIEETNEQLEQYIRQAIAETDWSDVEVLDIIHQVTITEYNGYDGEGSFTRGNSFQHHGYESKVLAPDVDTYYGIGDHHKQVYRITEYVCREIGVDPETGVDTDD